MSGRLPLFADPVRLASSRFRGSGTLALAAMARLAPSLYGDNGTVEVALHAAMEQGRAVLHGHLKGRLSLQCQRCMEAVSLEVDHAFSLGVIASEDEIPALPPACEPLLNRGEEIALADVFEDELLLLLPIIPLHEPGACQAALPAGSGVETTEDPEQRKKPFADLKKLLSEGKS